MKKYNSGLIKDFGGAEYNSINLFIFCLISLTLAAVTKNSDRSDD